MESENVVALDYRVLIDVDAAVWIENYGMPRDAVEADARDMLTAVLRDAVAEWLDRSGNTGRVQVKPA